MVRRTRSQPIEDISYEYGGIIMNNVVLYSTEDLPIFLTVAEASQVLRIGRNIVYELVRCGQLPSVKLGRQIRISKKALLDFMDRQ